MLLPLVALLLAPAAPASAASLTAVSWSISANGAGDADVTYSWSFTTATAGAISAISFTVPAGTAGTPVAGSALGIGPGTFLLAGGTLTYTVTVPATVPAGVHLLLSVEGLTNTATPGTYTSDVATAPGLDGPTTSNAVAIDAGEIPVTVTVEQAISFSSDTTAIDLRADPSVANDLQSAPASLEVATNAAGGYTLLAEASPLTTQNGDVLPAASSGVGSGVAPGAFPVNTWGLRVGPPTNGGVHSLTRAGALAANQYVGHSPSFQGLADQTGPTNGDLYSVITRVRIDVAQPAGSYRSNVIYTALASY